VFHVTRTPLDSRALQRNNRSGLSGLRLYVDTSKGAAPTLHVQASWSIEGRVCSTHYSTKAHGCIGATRLAILAREQRGGHVTQLTARQAWARMRARYAHGTT
jgi:hypothetical protein